MKGKPPSEASPAGAVSLRVLIPFLILFGGFFLFPVIYAFGMSLFVSRGLTSIYVGWNNYALAFHDADFWSSIVRMAYFGVIQVTIMLLLALVLASVLYVFPFVPWVLEPLLSARPRLARMRPAAGR